MRTAALLVLAVVAMGLAGPIVAPADPVSAVDPVALRLLPPLARVPCLVGLDGSLLPACGYDPERPGERIVGFDLLGESVRYRRGPRETAVPLAELQRLPDGSPRVKILTFLAGTDRFGRDLLSRMLTGARVSLFVGLLGVAGATALAAFAGLLAAFGGFVLDGLIGRVIDALLAMPHVVVVMILAAFIAPAPWLFALLLALTGWPAMARMVRAEARVVARSDIVAAARAAGASPHRIALRHALPHVLGTLLVMAGLRIGPYLLLEASLSFLGFGVRPPLPSWGNILADGGEVLLEAWWVATFPGLLLVATVVALNTAADRWRLSAQASTASSTTSRPR